MMTNNCELAEKSRNPGQTRKYHHELVGISWTHGTQGARLLVKIRNINARNDAHRNSAASYTGGLKTLNLLTVPVLDGELIEFVCEKQKRMVIDNA